MDGDKKQKDWYRILDAEPSDSLAELRLKYQKLALMCHPDKQNADMPAEEVEELVQRFIEINQAWKILGNEKTKKEYDMQRREDELMKNGLIYTVVHLENMDWNEDEQCYIYRCRCGGEYIISKEDADNTVSVVSCDTCSLTLEILQ